MNQNTHNVIVYIGRFQPVHNGHIATMKVALKQATKLVIVIGSANTPRDYDNPWTASEREAMIRACFLPEENVCIDFVYAENRLYSNTFWARNVEEKVNEVVKGYKLIKPSIGIIGNGKGDPKTAEYVNLFKKWERVPMHAVNHMGTEDPIHATKIRELMYAGQYKKVLALVPPPAYFRLEKLAQSEDFALVKAEYDFGVGYEKLFAEKAQPFGFTNHYTADSVVIQSGHVLLVRRKNTPGKGLWALPGGHVNPTETAYQASLRELDEETKLKVPRKVLEGSMFCEKLFDHPDRSKRGRVTGPKARTVDIAYGYKLDDAADLPKVKAGDDAAEVRWFTFAEIADMRGSLFEDHADIIEYMLARVPEERAQ